MDSWVITAVRALARVAIPLVTLAVGLSAGAARPGWLWRQPSLLARSLLATLVIVPAATILLVRALPITHEVRNGLVIMALSIGPVAALRNAGKAGGDVHYALGLDLILLCLSVVYVPAAVAVIGAASRQALRLSALAVARPIFWLQLLPLTVGLALARFAPRLALRASKPASVLGNALLGVLATAVLILTIRPVLHLGAAGLLTTAGAAALAIAVGHALGGPHPALRHVLATFCTIKFPALAILISTVTPLGKRVLPVVVAYLFISLAALVVYGVLGRRARGRRKVGAARPAPAGAA